MGVPGPGMMTFLQLSVQTGQPQGLIAPYPILTKLGLPRRQSGWGRLGHLNGLPSKRCASWTMGGMSKAYSRKDFESDRRNVGFLRRSKRMGRAASEQQRAGSGARQTKRSPEVQSLMGCGSPTQSKPLPMPTPTVPSLCHPRPRERALLPQNLQPAHLPFILAEAFHPEFSSSVAPTSSLATGGPQKSVPNRSSTSEGPARPSLVTPHSPWS